MVLQMNPVTGLLEDTEDPNAKLVASLNTPAMQTPSPLAPVLPQPLAPTPPPGQFVAALKPPPPKFAGEVTQTPPGADLPLPSQVPQQPKTIELKKTQDTEQTTTTEGKDTSVLNPGIAAKKKAIDAQTQFNKKEGAIRSDAAEELSDLNQKSTDQFEGQTAERDRALLESQLKRDQLADDVGKFQFDQNRFFKNMSTGQQVLAGLGVALSALGSGFTGKQNQALEIINQGIERDLKQQSQEYDKLKDKTAYANTAYGQLRQIYQDKEEADRKFFDLAKQNILQKADAKIATLYPEKTDAERQQLLADMNLKLGEIKLNAQGTKSKTTGGVTNREDKPLGFANSKERLDAVDQASKNPDIQKYKEARSGYSYIKDKTTLSPFELGYVIAGKEFLNQGSYSQNMADSLANQGYSQQVVSWFRKQAGKSTPVPPAIVKDIKEFQKGKLNSLADAAYETGKNYVAAGLDAKSVWGTENPLDFRSNTEQANNRKGKTVVQR